MKVYTITLHMNGVDTQPVSCHDLETAKDVAEFMLENVVKEKFRYSHEDFVKSCTQWGSRYGENSLMKLVYDKDDDIWLCLGGVTIVSEDRLQ